MSMSTTLLSFAMFKSISRWLIWRFSVTENILVQAIASSVVGTPLTASLWSVIPAYEYVRRDEEGGRRQFTMAELMMWSVGVCLFGTVFSVPFRLYFLRRQRLRYPSGYASGVIVGVLHNDDEVAARAEADKQVSEEHQVVAEDNEDEDSVDTQDPSSQAEAQQPVDWLDCVINPGYRQKCVNCDYISELILAPTQPRSGNSGSASFCCSRPP